MTQGDSVIISGNEKLMRPILTELMGMYQLFQANGGQGDYYSIPIQDYQAVNKYRPQVTFHFLEDDNPELNEYGLAKATAEVTYKLINETSQSMTESKAETIGLRIKELFGVNNGFTFEKGKTRVAYKDVQHGFDFRLYVANQSEGTKVIQKVIEVAEQEFFETNLRVRTSFEEIPPIPIKKEVYGQERNTPRRFPTAHVRFTKAFLDVWGLPKPVCLYDRTGRKLGIV